MFFLQFIKKMALLHFIGPGSEEFKLLSSCGFLRKFLMNTRLYMALHASAWLIKRINSFQPSVAFHIETSHLF